MMNKSYTVVCFFMIQFVAELPDLLLIGKVRMKRKKIIILDLAYVFKQTEYILYMPVNPKIMTGHILIKGYIWKHRTERLLNKKYKFKIIMLIMWKHGNQFLKIAQ